MRVAVLDLGSNTTKLLVAEVGKSGQIEAVTEESRACRLSGTGSEKDGICRFTDDIMNRVCLAVGELLVIARREGAQKISIVATEAFRRAENKDTLLSLILESHDLRVTVLSGEEEGNAIAAGLLSDPSLSGLDSFHAFDLGGGSMEVMGIVGKEVNAVVSLPLGAVVLTKRFLIDASSEWTAENSSEARKLVQSSLSTLPVDLCTSSEALVGAGGALVFLRKILREQGRMKDQQGSRITLSEVEEVFDQLAAKTEIERKLIFPFLPAGRADILPAGLLVIAELIRLVGQDGIIHSYRNLRYGIAGKLISGRG